MAYSNFTLDTVLEAFDLEEIDAAGIFADSEPLQPSDLLTAVFSAEHTPRTCCRHRKSQIRTNRR